MSNLKSDQVPLWWREVFPAGARQGFFRRSAGHSLRFVERSTDLLLISVEPTPVPGQESLADRVFEPFTASQGWTYLSLQVDGDADAFEALTQTLDELIAEERFSDCVHTVLIGQGAGADLALRLTAPLGPARTLAVCPSTPAAATGADVILFDPMTNPLPGALSLPKDTLALRLPFLGEDPLVALNEARLLATLIADSANGQLTAPDFHRHLRRRKTLPVYRAALDRRLAKRCPARPVAAAAWPKERGNVWMLEQRADGVLRYLSDRWRARTVGYEERNGVTLAQTAPVMYGMIGLGDGCGMQRPLPIRYPWHVVDETLSGQGPDFAARSHAALLAQTLEADGHALPGVVAIDLPQPGSRPEDLAPGSTQRQKLEARVGHAVQALTSWGRSLHVDRVILGLGAGAPELSADAAKRHYLDVVDWVQQAVPALTGQSIAPACVLTQSAGHRDDGRSEVILAESMLEAARPTSRVVVAGPAYPYPLMEDMPATPTEQARLLMDEVEAHALRALASGGRWFCPDLRLATWSENTITAAFTSLLPLVLEEGPHGFRIDGAGEDLKITEVKLLKGNRVELTCTRPPSEPGLALAYAWGWTKGPDATRPANHGALRDSWSAESKIVPGQKLYRYALAGRVALLPEEQVGSA